METLFLFLKVCVAMVLGVLSLWAAGETFALLVVMVPWTVLPPIIFFTAAGCITYFIKDYKRSAENVGKF